jgi:DNA-binding MarR family transcriptional regulator
MDQAPLPQIEQTGSLIAILELLKTGYWYDRKVRLILQPFEISHEQFNVLRILEHHRPRKFSLKEIQNRLMNKTANATRLVGKLKQKDLITSAYSAENRRLLEIRITDSGLDLLKRTRQPLKQLGDQISIGLDPKDSKELTRILRKIRSTG